MEDSRYEFRPVGFIRSCFKFKNGTPRQPGICTASQASLTISKEVYNNPEHSLVGLEQFSHVWVMFIFHKNKNSYDKAKVKPPRLNGAKVGVFSTRSPYRLNPIGLTLAKIERISGDTLYLSGVDMLDGTPVIDVKPYICEYDQPIATELDKTPGIKLENSSDCSAIIENFENAASCDSQPECSVLDNIAAQQINLDTDVSNMEVNNCASKLSLKEIGENCDIANGATANSPTRCEHTKFEILENESCNSNNQSRLSHDPRHERSHLNGNFEQDDEKGSGNINLDPSKRETLRTANWIAEPPIPKLKVRFTPSAASQLQDFSADAEDDNYKLKFISDAETAIKTILQADPRSTYRRTKCNDRLYFCAVDCMHVTAWFNDDDNIVEVLRVKPVAGVSLLQSPNT